MLHTLAITEAGCTPNATGKAIVSVYSDDKPYTVYDRKQWLEIDNTDKGRDVDFSRPFFEQWNELFLDSIKANIIQNGLMLNSDYTHFTGEMKNGYYMFNSGKCEDVYYGILNVYSKNCVDVYWGFYSELCYESVHCSHSYNLHYSSYSSNCSDSAFLRDCMGCRHCIGCTNLRNKEYHVFNKPVLKEEFESLWSEIFSGKHSAIEAFQQQWSAFEVLQPYWLRNVNAINSTGSQLTDCENVKESHVCAGCKNLKYCQDMEVDTEDCYDISTFGEGMTGCYEMLTSGGIKGSSEIVGCMFSAYIFYGGYNIYYSVNCHDNCKNLFGCCDLRGKQYCILNKQYTKEEYEELVPRIVEHMKQTGEWGEFFPVAMSPFGYNESLAMERFIRNKQQVVEQNWKWQDQESGTKNKETITWDAVPDSIADTEDSISSEILSCRDCQRSYRIIPQELEFYKNIQVPLPQKCFNCRHINRLKRTDARQLFERNCNKCQKAIRSTHRSESSKIVYCEECYLADIY